MNKKFLLLSTLCLLCGCGVNNQTSVSNNSSESSSIVTSSFSTIEKKNFKNIIMNDSIVTYDGNSHTIEPLNVPKEATIKHLNGPFVDAGEYQINVLITQEGYNDLNLQSKLTINKSDLLGVSLNDTTIVYDGLNHINDKFIVGNIPEDSKVVCLFKKDNVIVNEVIDVGEYSLEVTIVTKNFNELKLNCNIKIVSNEENNFIFKYDNKIFFNNSLDKRRLYSYDDSVKKVNGDIVKGITSYDNDIAYISSGFISSSIVKFEKEENNYKTTVLSSSSANYITSHGKNIYYSVNGLTQEQSGIYKLSFEGEEPLTTKIFTGKNKFLTIANNYLYFSNGKNDYKLSRISLSNNISNAELYVDKKINNLITDGNNLYFTVNDKLGDYIAKVSSKNNSLSNCIKLTTDAGKYLTVHDDELYYSNVDLLNSSLYGKGIYKIKTDGSYSSSRGVKIIDSKEDIITSLNIIDNKIYFYRTNTKHLFEIDLSTKKETDLLEGFVAPEENTPSTGGMNKVYQNYLYYLNIKDGKTLYRYDIEKKINIKLTSNKVTDFMICNDKLYYNQVSKFVDNDLYVVDLKNNNIQILSKDDLNEIVQNNNKIYAIKNNASGLASEIVEIDLNSFNQKTIYSKSAKNLKIINNKLYFINSGKIYYIDLMKQDNVVTQLGTVKNIDKFIIENDDIYYSYRGLLTKEIRKSNLSSFDEYKVVVSKNTDPLDFIIDKTNIYYYTQAESAGTNYFGIYKIDKTNFGDGKQIKILDNRYYASSLAIYNKNLYFIDFYGVGGLFGDSHIYEISIDSNENQIPTKIDIL